MKEFLADQIEIERQEMDDKAEMMIQNNVPSYIVNIVKKEFENRINHLKYLLDHVFKQLKD